MNTVNLDVRFVNMTGLNILDLSNLNTTVLSPINTAQTYGGDWLLKTPVQDEVCAAFPNPYDNDYRGADPFNPHDIPSRFVPDKPVFAKLPDDSYALFDSRMLLKENSLENPLIDGGGNTVLRSTLRANRDGLNVIVVCYSAKTRLRILSLMVEATLSCVPRCVQIVMVSM
jgi:hypothetical protein